MSNATSSNVYTSSQDRARSWHPSAEVVYLTGGIAVAAIFGRPDAGPGLSAAPCVLDVSDPWLYDRGEWDECFAEEPTPEAMARAVREFDHQIDRAMVRAMGGAL